MSDNGFNPILWDCTRKGCYNVESRFKIEAFAAAFPGRIGMSDLDAVVERNGHILIHEYKSSQHLPVGQHRMFRALSRFPGITVLALVGDPKPYPPTIELVKWFKDGIESEWRETSFAKVFAGCQEWARRAMQQPQPMAQYRHAINNQRDRVQRDPPIRIEGIPTTQPDLKL